MEEILNAPVTKLGLSEANATKLSEALNIQTVKDLATNQHFLLAQNCYLLAEAKATAGSALAEKKHPLLELVPLITGATVLLAALLYAAGWSYLYQYYKGFGLRVSELDLTVYDALVRSFTVIFNDFWSVFSLLLLITAGGTILSFSWIKNRLLTPLGIGLFLVAILSLGFWLSHKGVVLGAAQAREDMREKGSNLPNVRLKTEHGGATTADASGPKSEPKKEEGVGNEPPIQDSPCEHFDKAGYRLLIHANGHYYIFRPIKDSGLPASNLDLCVIPDSSVLRGYIQRGI